MIIVDIGYDAGKWKTINELTDYVMLSNIHKAMQETPGQSIISMEDLVKKENALGGLKANEPIYVLSHGGYGVLGNSNIPSTAIPEPEDAAPKVEKEEYAGRRRKAPKEIRTPDAIKGFGDILVERLRHPSVRHNKPRTIHLSCSGAISEEDAPLSLVEGTARAMEKGGILGVQVEGFVGDGLFPAKGIVMPKPFGDAYYEDGADFNPGGAPGKEEEYTAFAKQLVARKIGEARGRELGWSELLPVAKAVFERSEQYFKDLVTANRILCSVYPKDKGIRYVTTSIGRNREDILEDKHAAREAAKILYQYIGNINPREINESPAVKTFVERGKAHALSELVDKYEEGIKIPIPGRPAETLDSCLQEAERLYEPGFKSINRLALLEELRQAAEEAAGKIKDDSPMSAYDNAITKAQKYVAELRDTDVEYQNGKQLLQKVNGQKEDAQKKLELEKNAAAAEKTHPSPALPSAYDAALKFSRGKQPETAYGMESLSNRNLSSSSSRVSGAVHNRDVSVQPEGQPPKKRTKRDEAESAAIPTQTQVAAPKDEVMDDDIQEEEELDPPRP